MMCIPQTADVQESLLYTVAPIQERATIIQRPTFLMVHANTCTVVPTNPRVISMLGQAVMTGVACTALPVVFSLEPVTIIQMRYAQLPAHGPAALMRRLVIGIHSQGAMMDHAYSNSLQAVLIHWLVTT